MNLKEQKEQYRQSQIKKLREIKSKWPGKFDSFEQVKELLPEFEGIEIFAPWIRSPFKDIYGEELKKKEWDDYVLGGIAGAQMSAHYKKRGYEQYSIFCDDFLNSDISRGSNLNLIDRLDNMIDFDLESEEELVSVLTSRTTNNYLKGKAGRKNLRYEIQIPAIQVAQDIIWWCLENECVGYCQDW